MRQKLGNSLFQANKQATRSGASAAIASQRCKLRRLVLFARMHSSAIRFITNPLFDCSQRIDQQLVEASRSHRHYQRQS